jgi:putative transposase
MPNTYTQIFLQFVFAVSQRQCLIPREHKARLHEYIGGLLLHRGSKPLAIHCMPDHPHIFVGYKPTISIPDLIKEIKVESNEFINDLKWTPRRFSWQEGYGAFSYSLSAIDDLIKYIKNQEQHHRQASFKAEYHDMLRSFNVEYNNKYLFEFFDP